MGARARSVKWDKPEKGFFFALGGDNLLNRAPQWGSHPLQQEMTPMEKSIRTILVTFLMITLLGGTALAGPKDKQAPGQDKKAEKQAAKEDKQQAKAEEKADKKADEAPAAAEEPKKPKKPKKDKKDKKPGKDVIPGNNGTIKVDGEPFDLSHGNEAHVGCTFRINFFNFDETTKTSTVTFEGQAPSGGGVFLVDAVTFTGSDGSSPAYSLSSFDQAALATATPHPQQGYHVRVTTSTPYSNGNDTKSKVFWIDCAPAAAAPPPEVPARAAESIDLAPMESDSTEENDAEVLGSRVTRPQAAQPAESQGTEILGLALPFTGRSLVLFVIIGLALLAAGALVVNRSRA